MISVQEMMNDFDFITTFTVRRPIGAIDEATGNFDILSYTDIAFVGIVQPADPAAVAMFPEGERLGNVIEVWSKDQITVGDASSSVADVIVFQGESFRVFKEEDWSLNGYSHVFAEGYLAPAVPA